MGSRQKTGLTELEAALHRGEFFLEYLPTVSLTEGRCVGGEALVRWRRETQVTPPDGSMPAIENTPQSGLITYWVIETVMREMDEWLSANLGMYIGINVAPEILGRGGAAYAAARAGLDRHGKQLMLEIGGSGVPDALGVAALNEVRAEWGIKLALDNVTRIGSNLPLLALSSFDAIKIDKSLIDAIGHEQADSEWLHTVAAIVTSSNLLVIAEGVESERQVRALREAHVQAAQGFYFSRPLNAAAFMAFARDYAMPDGARD